MFNQRYYGNAFEDHFLPRLTTEEVKKLRKDNALIVLPVGATEQHGPHLPLYTDTLIGEGLLAKAFDLLDEENIWMLPPIPYGKSTEHLGMPGTITLSSETLQAVVMDIAKSVADSGFEKLLLFNTHGGNHDLLNMMAREIRIATGLVVFRLNPDYSTIAHLLSEEEQKYGIHGGEVETSMVLDIKPNWVVVDLCPTEFVQIPDNSKLYLKGNNYVAWVTKDISNTGISGNAAIATVEKGEEFNSLVSKAIAGSLKEMCQFNMSNLKGEGIKR